MQPVDDILSYNDPIYARASDCRSRLDTKGDHLSKPLLAVYLLY